MKVIQMIKANNQNSSALGNNVSDGRLTERYSVEEIGGDARAVLNVRNLSMDSIDAMILNVSETGMGIATRNELLLGQMVDVSSKINAEIPDMAVVMWAKKEEDEYRAGLKFLRAE